MRNILYIEGHVDTWNYNPTDTSEVRFSIKTYFGQFLDDDAWLNITHDKYQPMQGDKIYFLPDVNIPRIKFKNLSLEYNIKTVRNFNDATVFFGNKKSYASMVSSIYAYKMPTEDFKHYVENLKHRMDDYTYEKLQTALEFYDNDTIAVDTSINRWIDEVLDGEYSSFSNKLEYVNPDYSELYERLQTATIYDESSVICILNGEDAAPIDETMYLHIAEMFKSSDTDNRTLAMEIMANCKYDDSLLYLELLFKDFSHRISDSSTKNHVNFKSLISYLGKGRYFDTSIDDVIKSLMDKNQFSVDKIDSILKYCKDDIENTGNSKYFKVKEISLSSEILEKYNLNYQYEVQPDIKLEVPEEELCSLVAQVEDIADEDIETALLRVERKELKSELIALEENLAKEDLTPVKEEEELNNNQIKETNGSNDFDWF